MLAEANDKGVDKIKVEENEGQVDCEMVNLDFLEAKLDWAGALSDTRALFRRRTVTYRPS